MRIIPAIDIIDGNCVRLTQGDFNQKKVYNKNPLEVARQFEDYGIQYLHLVDLDGARSGNIVNTKVLEDIAGHTQLKIDFGGGIKTDEAIRIAFECGASQVTGGSIAVKNKALFSGWIRQYGKEQIILGADVLDGQIAVSGWAENSGIPVYDFIGEYLQQDICYVVCTDISKDGLLQGCATDLYQELLKRFPAIKLIASGGVANLADLDQLKALPVDGVIIGKAIYENRISLKELRNYVD